MSVHYRGDPVIPIGWPLPVIPDENDDGNEDADDVRNDYENTTTTANKMILTNEVTINFDEMTTIVNNTDDSSYYDSDNDSDNDFSDGINTYSQG